MAFNVCHIFISLLCLFLPCYSQDVKTCTAEIRAPMLEEAIKSIKNTHNTNLPGNTTELDGLFHKLREQPTSLVILMDTSIGVRPSHFYLVNKRMVDALLKNHVDSAEVFVSLISFDLSSLDVLCQDVRNDCDELQKCVAKMTYNRSNEKWYLDGTLSKSLDKAYAILSQNATANVQRVVLVVSAFFVHETDKVDASKSKLKSIDAEIYTVFSSYYEELAIAGKVATTLDKHVTDAIFLEKVFSTTPHHNACAGRFQAGRTDDSLKENMICNGQDCLCRLGYTGSTCNEPLHYCNESYACPANSKCTERSMSYTCSCSTCSDEACLNIPHDGPIPPPSSPILTIIGYTFGGIGVIIAIAVAVACFIKHRHVVTPIYERWIGNAFTRHKNRPAQSSITAQSSTTASSESLRNVQFYQNAAYVPRDENDSDIENYGELKVMQRGMASEWKTYIERVLGENRLRDVCVIKEDQTQFATSLMKFLPTNSELATIRIWFSGVAKPGKNINYKGIWYKVTSNMNDTIKGLSTTGSATKDTRICISRTDIFYIIGVRIKVQQRGDLEICCSVVEEIKNALNEGYVPPVPAIHR